MGGSRGRLISSEKRQMALTLINEARDGGARLEPACEVLEISERTYRRWLQLDYDRRIDRKNPAVAVQRRLSQAEKQQVIDVCNDARFSSLPPSQIVPRLADEGIYIASESSFYRILREYGQNARRGRTQTRNKPVKPSEIKVTQPGQCYSWDITFLQTLVAGLFFKLYMIIDIFSRKIVGWEVHETESSELARDLIYKTQLKEKVDCSKLVIHSDNGSPMKGLSLKALMESLGITASYSRPSVSNDNPFSESLFRTLKYCPNYPEKPFETLDDARQWVLGFVTWYNNEHLHSALKFVTPEQRHTFQDRVIFSSRDSVYKAAQELNPNRWSGQTRNWKLDEEVVLNPDKKKEIDANKAA